MTYNHGKYLRRTLIGSLAGLTASYLLVMTQEREAAAVLLAVVSVPCAGGFTGALALSEAAPAGLFVVAAGAFALFGSVAGAAELAEAVGV